MIRKLNFSHDKYFYSRPFIVGYNWAGINNTNFNPEYLTAVNGRIDSFMVYNPEVNKTVIPSEMINANGSGPNPHVLM